MITKLSEVHIHIIARTWLKRQGWTLVAGEFPGGSDHELYPLNVVNPAVARDRSPAPRQHSKGELIPDIVALKGRAMLIAEAKLGYCEADENKLARLMGVRRQDLLFALNKFSIEKHFTMIPPVNTLSFYPTLIFISTPHAPAPKPSFSHMVVHGHAEAEIIGALALAGLV